MQEREYILNIKSHSTAPDFEATTMAESPEDAARILKEEYWWQLADWSVEDLVKYIGR